MSVDEADENIPPPSLKPGEGNDLDPDNQPTTSAYGSEDDDTLHPPALTATAFSWTQFQQERASLPATSSRIAQHAEHLQKTLAEVVFAPNTTVMVGHHPDMIPAIMKSLCGDIAFVEFYDENSSEEVKVDQLVLPVTPMPLSGFAKDNIAGIPHNQMEKLDEPVSTFVQVGNYFELIETQDPLLVRVVKIIDNSNGFVRAVDAKGRQYSTFMGSEYCKRLGFSLLAENEGEFRMEPFLGATVKMTTPWYVFCRTNFKKHSVEPGHVVEVIDPVTRFRFLPAVVTDIINKFFFRVQLLMPAGEEKTVPTHITFHRSSTDVFPTNFASKNGMRLTAPAGYDENTFTIYKIKGRVTTEAHFDLPKNVERFDSGRHLEVYDQHTDSFHPATILRQHKHLLFLRFEDTRDMSHPKLYSYTDERLFKCGSAELYGRPLITPEVQIDRLQWSYTPEFKLTSNVLDVDSTNGIRYMVKCFANNSEFLPRLYLNFDCYKGPFLNPQRSRHLDSAYPASHFQIFMYQVINDILEVLTKAEFQKICEATPHSRAPKYSIKLTHPRSDLRSKVLDVEVCERASEFPGWLRQFLLKFDICPNLISPRLRAPGEPCPLNCHRLHTLPALRNNAHLNIPINVSKVDEMRARRLNVAPSVNSNSRTKRENSDRQIQKSAEDFTDLDQPLPLRRTRRHIIPTKRKEMQEEMQDSLKQARTGLTQQRVVNSPCNRSRWSAAYGLALRSVAEHVHPDRAYRCARLVCRSVPSRTTFDKWLRELATLDPHQLVTQARKLREPTASPQGQENLSPPALTLADKPLEQLETEWFKPEREQYLQSHRRRELSAQVDNSPARKRRADGSGGFTATRTQSHGVIEPQPSRSGRKAGSQPPQLELQGNSNELMEMANKIDDVHRISSHQVRLNTSGPRVLLPKSQSPPDKTAHPASHSPPPPLSRSPSENRSTSPNQGPSTSYFQPPADPSNGKSSPTEAQKICQRLGIDESEEPREWDTKRLCEVVKRLKLDALAEFLEKEEFDGESFFLLTEHDFVSRLQLKTGPLMKTMRLLADLKILSPDMPNLEE